MTAASVEVRPFSPGDLEPVCALLAAALPHDRIDPPRFTRQVLLDPNFREAGAFVARADGAIAGFALALRRRVPLENAPPDPHCGYITLLAVAASLRRRGIGGALLQEAESWLRAQGCREARVAPYAPGYFIPGVPLGPGEPGLPFMTSRGYAEIARPLSMTAALPAPAAAAWIAEAGAALRAAGGAVEPFRASLGLPLLRFLEREFPGDWVRVGREAMARILSGDPPERLLIAWERGQVLGFAHHEGERFGPIGVAEAARGRGLGHLLMHDVLAAMHAAGARQAYFLWSDDRTARRLYDSAGFRESRRFAVMRRGLEGDG